MAVSGEASLNNVLRAGLVGQGISRSLTPAMHMEEGRAQGFSYSFDLIDMNSRANLGISLPETIDKALEDGFAGLNITHPYKIEVLQYLDHLSDTARRLGAVNTVVFQGAKKSGHNTDYSGFVASFQRDMRDAKKERVLLLGAGGAGAAVAFGLLDCGVREIVIYDANSNQTGDLVKKLQANYPKAKISAVQAVDSSVVSGLNGIVNATPMGMADYPGAALRLDLLSADIWVADVVYFPLETALLAQARAVGCRLLSGSGMALFQAVHSFQLFTGRPADTGRMANTFERLSARLLTESIEKEN